MSVLVIVFVGQCEVFACLDFGYFFFFPWPRSSWVRERGVNSLKKMSIFFDTRPFNPWNPRGTYIIPKMPTVLPVPAFFGLRM